MSPLQLQRIRRTLERRAREWLAAQPVLSHTQTPGAVSAALVAELATAVELGEARAELLLQLERFVAQRFREQALHGERGLNA
jgi:hypothetical protein